MSARPQRGYWKAAAWFVFALVSQVAQLQLIWAGTEVRYQHWRIVLGGLDPGDEWLFTGLGVYSVVVLWAGRRWMIAAGRWLWERLGPWSMMAMLATLAVLSVSPQKDPRALLLEIALACTFILVQLVNIALVVNSIAAKTRATASQRIRDWLDKPTGVVPAALFVVIAATALNLTVWERHPHITDEVAYYFQAQYFAEGQLQAPAAPVPEAFDIYLVPCDQQGCHSVFPPGWPYLLSLGMRLGAPWLVNPLLGGLNVILLYWLMRELFDPRTAKLAAMLGAVSPWQIYMAMNFMSHTFVLTCGLAAGIACARVWKGGPLWFAAVGGAALGLMSLARPLDALALAGVVGVWMLFFRGGVSWPGITAATLTTVGAAAVGALVLPYNTAMMGKATEFPVMSYMNSVFGPGANSLGFGSNRGGPTVWGAIDAFPGHSPMEAGINAYLNANAIHTELFGWAVGSLLAALLLFFSGWAGRRDWLMLAPVLAIVAWYSLYYFSGGPDFGSRYWYLVFPSAVVLSARGILELEARIGSGALLAAAALSVIALLTFVPWRGLDKYNGYWGMTAEVRDRLAAGEFQGGLVLIQGTEQGDYSSARIYNPLDLESSETIVAYDRSPEVRARLEQAYPGRRIWLVEGPSLTGSGYRVVEVGR